LYLGLFLAYFAMLSLSKDIKKIPRDDGDQKNVGKMLDNIEKMTNDIV
jgi:hypothetical protein